MDAMTRNQINTSETMAAIAELRDKTDWTRTDAARWDELWQTMGDLAHGFKRIKGF